jgi:hypothetical protein
MVNEPPAGLAALEGHHQGINAQACLEVIGHRPADNLARRHILEGGQIQKALVGRDVRDVGQPHGVGLLGHKGPTEPIRRNRQVVAAVRG